ncbi:MAG: hypothetical protein ABSA92_14895 [Candidatus Bathyarchaeia archaeon]|jgi:hypothetical protein
MPSHRVHKEITRWLLGKPHAKVHRAIDYPYKFLGPKHRILFHDPVTSVLVAKAASREKGAGKAAILHVLTDALIPSRVSDILDFAISLKKRLDRAR